MLWVIRLNGADERLDCASAIPLIGDFSIGIENFQVTASTAGSNIQAFIGSLTSFEDFIGVRASDWIIRIDNNTYTIPFTSVPEPLTRASLLITRVGNQLTLQHGASSSTITVTTNNFVIGCFGVINASTPVSTHFFGGDLGDITIDAAYLFDVDNSDHSGSTAQPIITDTVGGNDAIGVNFPAFDPDVWVFVGTPPTTTYIRFNKEIIGADMSYKQGVAVANFPFTMRDSSNDPVTTGTTTGVMVKNGVASATLANASYIGNNFWNISFTASEMDGADQVAFTPVNTNAVVEEFILKTYTELDANLLEINGATLPVDNLESQYDGAGITGDNFPSTQSQVGNISSGAGGLKDEAESVTLTTGTSTDPLSNTFNPDDGLFYTVTPAAGAVDFEFGFDIGSSSSSTKVDLRVFVQGNNDEVFVQAFNHVSQQFEQIGKVVGTSSQTVQIIQFNTTTNKTGTGADAGKVRIRFLASSITLIGVDQILTEYSVKAESSFVLYSGQVQSATANTIVFGSDASDQDDFYKHARITTPYGTGVGQERVIVDYTGATRTAIIKEPWVVIPDATTGANITPAQTHAATIEPGYQNNAIYIDTTNGTDGSLIGVNGTVDNPVLTMAVARALADTEELNSNRIVFDKGIDVATFDQNYERFFFSGRNPVAIDLNGYGVSFSSFDRVVVTGTCTNSLGVAVYTTCGILDFNCGESNFVDCGLVTRLTMSQSGKCYTTQNLYPNKSNINDPDPEIVFNSNGISGIKFEGNDISGNYTVKGIKSVDIMELSGRGIYTLDSTVNGGLIYYAGDIKFIDNSTVSPTFVCGNICDIAQKIDDVPTATELNARTLPSADYFVVGDYTAPDNATIASIDAKVDNVPTVAEFNARTLLSADYFDPATDIVANVTTVQTTVTNTDMRGTDNALLASTYVTPDNATIASIDAKIDNVPTVAEFNARTLPSANYFDPLTDQVIIGTNNDKSGYSIAGTKTTLDALNDFDATAETVTINAASVDAVFAGGDIDGYTLEQSQRLILASQAGKFSGGGTSNVVIRDAADTKARITATVDQDGNRISTTLDAN